MDIVCAFYSEVVHCTSKTKVIILAFGKHRWYLRLSVKLCCCFYAFGAIFCHCLHLGACTGSDRHYKSRVIEVDLVDDMHQITRPLKSIACLTAAYTHS